LRAPFKQRQNSAAEVFEFPNEELTSVRSPSRRQLAVIKSGWELRMCHNALLRDEFYEFLLRIDEDLAAETQADGCRRCGSALHKNRYQRKPRGGGLIGLGKGPHFHFSLSCSRCEKRHNPRSVRFLGRRVYLAAIVVLASALRSGLTGRRAKQLTEWLRVPRTTIGRWRAWWVQGFVESSFWKVARAQFMPVIAIAALPSSLLERFRGLDLLSQLVTLLRFLSPLNQRN